MSGPVAPFRLRGIEDGIPHAPQAGAPRESVFIVNYHRSRRPRPKFGPPAQTSAPPQPRVAPIAPITPAIADAIQASPFAALGLSGHLVRALLDEGYATPSPVQAEVVPHALIGRDVLAGAQTGTGKTAAFMLPILQQLGPARARGPVRCLILAPTRELAAQVHGRAIAYGRYLEARSAVIYGGVSQRAQEAALAAFPDIVVATPGRLLDLLRQRKVDLRHVTHLVLDEADRMLDMGFVHDVRRIVAELPVKRQTLFFSATMAPPVEKLARGMLVDPVRVAITPTVTTATTVSQSVVFVGKSDKRALLETVLRDQTIARALVFTRTKHGANRLAEHLARSGIGSAAVHGNKTQGARERALAAFRSGATRVLVATDVAARGIDVQGVSLVVNFDLPNVAESYVHRIGRTGRAGATGRAISFCDHDERALLGDIERLIRRRLPVNDAVGAPVVAQGGRP